MLFSTPQPARASRTRSGRTSAVMISSTRPDVPCAMMLPSKLTIMPSPMLSNEPSLPHMQTLAVTMRLQNAFDRLVKRHEFPDWGRIAGGSEHNFRALVGALARHLREHAIMADDERELATARAIDDGNAQIARLPRLDGHPRVQLAIIELHLALVVDDDAGVVGIAPWVELHDGETAPDLVLDAGRLERCDFRPIHPAHDGRVRIHRQAVSAYSGNTTRSIVPRLRRALPTIETMRAVCAARSSGVTTMGN